MICTITQDDSEISMLSERSLTEKRRLMYNVYNVVTSGKRTLMSGASSGYLARRVAVRVCEGAWGTWQ